MAPLTSAIAAGNGAVVKPSEHAPATAALIARLIAECFDAGHAAELVRPDPAGVHDDLGLDRPVVRDDPGDAAVADRVHDIGDLALHLL